MLKKLTGANGVSGCEGEVRELILSEIRDCGCEVTIDHMGNIIAKKPSQSRKNAPTVLLSAHMDEVGFIVTDITSEGFLRFESVGGIDPKILPALRVMVNGCYGVITLKPIHLTTNEERQKNLQESDLLIDIGAKDEADAKLHVSKGDYISFVSEFEDLGDMIKAKALDDRLGCAVLIEMLKKTHNVNLICTFTTQEEVGLRGSKVAVFGIKPDYALVIEGTTCSDITDTPKHLRVTKSGCGCAISVLDSASKANSEMICLLEKTAQSRKIPYQLKASTAGGNDAGAIHTSCGGIKTATISVPCRYIHSGVSIMHKNDFKSCLDLTAAFLEVCGGMIYDD